MNESSENLNELFCALSKAQGVIENAIKDKANPYFKSNYADLASVWQACRAPLSSNGLSIMQTVTGSKESMVLVTVLGHSSGQYITSKLPIVCAKLDPQGLGSAITYSRRYALSAIVGICPDDDDGEKAMDRIGSNNQRQIKIEPKKETQVSAAQTVNLFLSKEQQTQLLELFDKCPEYAIKPLSLYGSIEKIPADKFERARLGAIKSISEKQNSSFSMSDYESASGG